jgi:hypothetical protein
MQGLLAAKESEAALLRQQLAQLTADFKFNLKVGGRRCWAAAVAGACGRCRGELERGSWLGSRAATAPIRYLAP